MSFTFWWGAQNPDSTQELQGHKWVVSCKICCSEQLADVVFFFSLTYVEFPSSCLPRPEVWFFSRKNKSRWQSELKRFFYSELLNCWLIVLSQIMAGLRLNEVILSIDTYKHLFGSSFETCGKFAENSRRSLRPLRINVSITR